MPHSLIKDYISNFGYYSSIILAELEIYAREYAEKELNVLIEQLIRETCPDVPELEKSFEKLDRIERVTVNTNIKIEKVNDTIQPIKKAIKAGKLAADLLAHFNIPVAIPVTPPPGSPLFSLPQGILTTKANILRWINGTVNTLQNDVEGIIQAVKDTKDRFQPIIDKIEVVRNLAQGCATDPSLSLEERQSILEGLKTSTITGKDAEEYQAKNGQIYLIEVVSDPESPAIAPRRQAIAKNLQGVVVLKGPLSFSSSTDILIKELKFRIDNQLP